MKNGLIVDISTLAEKVQKSHSYTIGRMAEVLVTGYLRRAPEFTQ